MKTLWFTIGLLVTLVVRSLADSTPTTKPIEVIIETPSSGWQIQIKQVLTKEDKLLVICQLTQPEGASPSVISKVKASVDLPEKYSLMKRDVYVLGKTWNWGKGHTAVTPKELKVVIKGAEMIYTSEPDRENKPDEKKAKESDDDFINLKYEDAVKLANKRGLRQRIVEEDGKIFPVTLDYDLQRLNFTLKNGVVTEVSRG